MNIVTKCNFIRQPCGTIRYSTYFKFDVSHVNKNQYVLQSQIPNGRAHHRLRICTICSIRNYNKEGINHSFQPQTPAVKRNPLPFI